MNLKDIIIGIENNLKEKKPHTEFDISKHSTLKQHEELHAYYKHTA